MVSTSSEFYIHYLSKSHFPKKTEMNGMNDDELTKKTHLSSNLPLHRVQEEYDIEQIPFQM
jgi:hypothetical protein